MLKKIAVKVEIINIISSQKVIYIFYLLKRLFAKILFNSYRDVYLSILNKIIFCILIKFKHYLR